MPISKETLSAMTKEQIIYSARNEALNQFITEQFIPTMGDVCFGAIKKNNYFPSRNLSKTEVSHMRTCMEHFISMYRVVAQKLQEDMVKNTKS